MIPWARRVRTRGARGAPLVIAIALLAAAVGLAVGFLSRPLVAPVDNDPAEDSVDVGFARDMREHHGQAVEMSVLVRDRTTDPEVRTLALDVMLTQQQQAGQMFGWLSDWGVSQSRPGSAMQWMSSDTGTGTASEDNMHGGMSMPMTPTATSSMSTPTPATAMPGMASAVDLRQLGTLSGAEAERLYLQLMIPHHQGAVAMAEVAATEAGSAVVRRLAQTIVDSQSAEVLILQQMLAARGGPLTDRG
ncbi:DUF305 domain-containing protein [Kineococcus rubinsiae]|uniref:DUF305 domain-containing protein n=1 Tax=Kineococcus rubinsiae TaxID=2609562 RepID=UPI0027E3F5D2|nr:DUF305 domain-containing protein [Kineococcus rubinsiae]